MAAFVYDDQQKVLYFYYGPAKFCFSIIGNGPETLLVFHGYDQNKAVFDTFGKVYREQYTIYAFDLFFHGDSQWLNKDKPVSKAFLHDCFSAFFRAYHIERFSVAGFSMGGKFALLLSVLFASYTDKLILLAPDGLKTTFYYNTRFYPAFFKKWLRFTVNRPNQFFIVFKILNKLKLLDKSMIKFVDSQFQTKTQRLKIYYSWVLLKHVHINRKRLISLIKENNISVILVLGKYDKVVKYHDVKGFVNKLNGFLSLYYLEAGHNNLIDAYVRNLSNKN